MERPGGTDGSEVLLATVVVGNFLAIPTASQHVQFIPNSGIRLHNVAIGDTGTYSVHVNINLHGSLITEVQTVDVHVSDDPLTTDGQLHVKMLPDAVYDNSTDTFNVQLSCGDFKTEWAPKASVSWKEDNRLKQEDNRLKQELETLRQDNANLKTDLTSKLDTAARSVSFHALMNRGPYNAGEALTTSHTYTNDGKAYNETSGVFTVPVKTFVIFLNDQLHYFIPNSGILLHNVAVGDTGTYSVHVNINLHGSLITEVQTVDVHVSDDPLTTDGQLHVKMLPDAVYNSATDTFNVQLSCGDFKTDGEYTCKIDNTSPISLCVQSDSPLKRGATIVVDGTEARITLMEARTKRKEEEYEARLATQQTEIQNLKITHQEEVANLTQQVETLRQDKLNTAARSVIFHAMMDGGPYNAGDTLNGFITHTNDGSAYNKTSGVFTVPVSGTYILLATVTVSSESSRKIDDIVRIYVDGSQVSGCYSSYTDHYETGSCHAILKLRAGQRVWLHNNYDHSLYYGAYTSFTGALLHADLS
nr:hypothetical protein BaRGS_008654 [Batillaria attramentaria]